MQSESNKLIPKINKKLYHLSDGQILSRKKYHYVMLLLYVVAPMTVSIFPFLI